MLALDSEQIVGKQEVVPKIEHVVDIQRWRKVALVETQSSDHYQLIRPKLATDLEKRITA
jgi:hypothetical protein